MTARARSLGEPITMRSGRRKSSMAAPSLRNSGLETTSNLHRAARGDLRLHARGGADRHRALVHHHRVLFGHVRDLPGHAHGRAQVGVPVVALRRSHRDEDHLGGAHRVLEHGGEAKPLGGDVLVQQLLEAGLVDGTLPLTQRRDLLRVHVDADDGVPRIREADAGHQTDVARPDHHDAHPRFLRRHPASRRARGSHGAPRGGLRRRGLLLDGDGLGEVARLVHVGAAVIGHVVAEELQRDHRDDGA